LLKFNILKKDSEVRAEQNVIERMQPFKPEIIPKRVPPPPSLIPNYLKHN